MPISRRDFLMLAAAASLQLDERPHEDMMVRSTRPEDLEMPLSDFSEYVTPVDRFFVRTHVYVPAVNMSEWRLRVEGHVSTALTLTMDELRQLPSVEQVSVLECAGNGRGLFEPSVPGLQWETGGVGNGRWRGVRLGHVLKRAGIKGSAVEILFDGADVPLRTMPDFQRSIPVGKALDGHTLLAYEMNGDKLSPKHGFPLRVVVPGWASDSWVKWLTTVRVLDREHDGYWMKSAYRRPRRPVAPGAAVGQEDMQPVTGLRVKSVIAAPRHGAQVLLGQSVAVQGVAWSGESGPVTAVDVSVDGGRHWHPAALRRDQRTQFGWRQWAFNWTPTEEAYYTILARARDATGDIQPLEQEWNPSGYLWNVVPRVGIEVVTKKSAVLRTEPSPSAKPSFPSAFRAACVTCHDDDVIRQQRLNREQWNREIEKMTGWGARVNEGDRAGFIDFLLENYGPRPRGR